MTDVCTIGKLDASRLTAGVIAAGTITSFHWWRGKMRSWDELTERDKVWIKAAWELEFKRMCEEPEEKEREPFWFRLGKWLT